MRDIFVTLVVFGSLPFIIRRPYIGVLMWAWLGFMNPHRLCWGFATTMPFALMVAVATLVGLMIAKDENKEIPWTRESVLLLIFIIWMFVSTIFANYPWLAWEQWSKVWRIMLMTYVTMILINDKHRIHLLMTVIALSLAFYGVKGGVFVLTGGSAHSVMGPGGTFIADRNSIALALIMTVPLLWYLRLQATRVWQRHALMAAGALTLVAIVGTHSRGGLLGLLAMGFFFLLKARKRFSVIMATIPLVLVILYVMPQQWFERMQTIQSYEMEVAAQGRLYAWRNAIRIANDNFMGGGFKALIGYGATDSHSNWFGVLGEHGYIGLAMFVLLHLFMWRSASWIMRNGKRHKELYWARDLAAMIQVSMIGYMSAGSFLGLQYFDLFYALLAVIVVTKVWMRTELARMEGAAAVTLADVPPPRPDTDAPPADLRPPREVPARRNAFTDRGASDAMRP